MTNTVSLPNRTGPIVYFSAAIANGESLSAAVDLGAYRLSSIIMPAAWTAAGLTFQGSIDGVTFGNMKSEGGTELAWTVAASDFLYSTPLNFWGVRFIKVRSGTAGTPVNQGAARTLTLIAVPHA